LLYARSSAELSPNNSQASPHDSASTRSLAQAMSSTPAWRSSGQIQNSTDRPLQASVDGRSDPAGDAVFFGGLSVALVRRDARFLVGGPLAGLANEFEPGVASPSFRRAIAASLETGH
jgi:hypothetical protein